MEEIEHLAAEYEVKAAWVSVVGAVRHASFAYYDQEDRRYIELDSDEHHELFGFVGNISVRDGRAFLHAHAGFAARHGGTVARPPAPRLRGLRRGGHDPRDDRRGAQPHAR